MNYNMAGNTLVGSATSNGGMILRQPPVKIISQEDDGNAQRSQISKGYPRHILLAASHTMVSWIQRADGVHVRTITIKDSRATRYAVVRILNFLFELRLPRNFYRTPQIPIDGNATFDQLTQLYQGILFFNLFDYLSNQFLLRNKIWEYINGDSLAQEDVAMVWVRLRYDQPLQWRCLHAFVDKADEENLNADEDVWAGYLGYFSGVSGGLYSRIQSIRGKKASRIRREEHAQQDDVEELAQETEQLAISGGDVSG